MLMSGLQGVFPTSPHVLCGLGDRVLLGVLWRVLQEYRVPDTLQKAIRSLIDYTRSFVCILSQWSLASGNLEMRCFSFVSKWASWGGSSWTPLTGCFFRPAQLWSDPAGRSGHAGRVMSPKWPGNTSKSPRMTWEMSQVKGKSGLIFWSSYYHNATPNKQRKIDGWIEVILIIINLQIKSHKIKSLSKCKRWKSGQTELPFLAWNLTKTESEPTTIFWIHLVEI